MLTSDMYATKKNSEVGHHAQKNQVFYDLHAYLIRISPPMQLRSTALVKWAVDITKKKVMNRDSKPI